MLDKFEKKFGKKTQQISCVDTGIDNLKLARGQIIELRGKPKAGKLFFALNFMKYAGTAGMESIIIDADHSFDSKFLQPFEIKEDEIFIGHPRNSDQSLELVHNLLSNKKLGIFITINTILSLFPQDKQYQQLMKKFEKLHRLVAGSENIVLIINPYTEKRYNILNEYANTCIYLRRRESIKKNQEFVGYYVDGKILKNTLNLQLGNWTHKILYDKGLQQFDSFK